jgi:hypothetical protein
MPANLRVSSLIPAGLVVETVIKDGDFIVVTARVAAWTATDDVRPKALLGDKGYDSDTIRENS